MKLSVVTGNVSNEETLLDADNITEAQIREQITQYVIQNVSYMTPGRVDGDIQFYIKRMAQVIINNSLHYASIFDFTFTLTH